MFWGLVIEPGKRYSQTVRKSFHLSMATLEINNNDSSDPVPLIQDYNGQEYILCNLHKQRMMQCHLDLNFKKGEKVTFYSSGRSRIHLTGYLLEEFDEFESDEEDEEEEEEVVANNSAQVKKRKEALTNIPGSKKIKLGGEGSEDDDDDDDYFGPEEEEEEEDDDDDDDDVDVEEEEEEEDDDEDESDEQASPAKHKLDKSQQNRNKTPGDKNKKKDVSQTPKTPVREQNGQIQTPQQSGKKNKHKQQGETPKGGTPNIAQTGTPQKKTLQGGVVAEDKNVGNGAVAKPGREVTVFYVGKLKQNNRQFDSTTSGSGFKFHLGRNEVIKGWDIGVAGMRVGGKRTLTIPAHMAYGKRGQPPAIPPNSTLVFDVELKAVN